MPESLEMLSVTELIAQCGNGDNSVYWSEFLRRYHRRILMFTVRIRRGYGQTSDEANAIADIAQEVYIRLLANNRSILREFRGDDEPSLLAYLSCIVHSVVTDQLRRDSRLKRLATLVSLDTEKEKSPDSSPVQQLQADEQSSPDRMLSDRMASKYLQNLLKKALSGSNAERDALIFKLHVVYGLSMREISEIESLKISQGNAEQIIRRTRERLRTVINSSDAQS